jgi:hypothetical protein
MALALPWRIIIYIIDKKRKSMKGKRYCISSDFSPKEKNLQRFCFCLNYAFIIINMITPIPRLFHSVNHHIEIVCTQKPACHNNAPHTRYKTARHASLFHRHVMILNKKTIAK